MPYIQVKTLRQAGIISVKDMQYGDQEIEDHLNDGWSIVNVTYLDAANVRFVLLQREMVDGGGGVDDKKTLTVDDLFANILVRAEAVMLAGKAIELTEPYTEQRSKAAAVYIEARDALVAEALTANSLIKEMAEKSEGGDQ